MIGTNLDYEIMFLPRQLTDEETSVFLPAIKEVQKSVGWIVDESQWNSDYSIAKRRLNNACDPKVFVIDQHTRELLGYAILRPDADRHNGWYLAQLAVRLTHQSKGVGTAIMGKIFEEAFFNSNMSTIRLETEGDEPGKLKFYERFASESIYMERSDVGHYTNGQLKTHFEYTLLHG